MMQLARRALAGDVDVEVIMLGIAEQHPEILDELLALFSECYRQTKREGKSLGGPV
jgi:hypothetical protein